MIDLGVLGPGSERAHPFRRKAVRRGSRLGIVLLIVALSLTLSGELGPASARLRVLSSLPFASGAQYVIDGDTAFVAAVGRGGNRVSGYDLASGRRLWSTTVASLSTLVNLQAAEGVLVATMYAPGLDGDHTVALDEASGRVLWHDRYSMDMLLPAGRVLLAHSYAVDTGPVARQGVMLSEQLATSVEAVDLRSGRSVWTYGLDAGCQHAATGQPASGTRLAVLCPGGDLRVVDLMTGRVLRSTRVPPPKSGTSGVESAAAGTTGSGDAGSAGAGSGDAADETGGDDSGDSGDGDDRDTLGIAPVLSTIGERLLVGSDGNGSMRVIAYDADTLRTLWTVTGTGTTYGTYPCAQLLCLSDDRGLTVLDPDSGKERWHTPQHVAVEVPGAGPAPQLPPELAGDLLVQPLGAASAGMVAAGDGRPLLYLDRWQSITGATRLPLFARWPDVPDGRVWFGMLTGEPLALSTIGFAPDVLKGQCRSFGDYLVCETLVETLRIWRYQP
ncbi:outer membrane protein assembly factor BamB family protein [Rugosimonospora africana]|nr:PQQ-binding-like beta-propeller repeat protein [Rugosimonospora africana]